MEVSNLLDIHTREELYAWYLENHDKVPGFWLRVNRAREPFPGVVSYVDAVEVALCFGWNNIERCRRLIELGEMTPAGLAVLPDHNPDNFVYEPWVVDALKADPIVWENFNSFPGAYRRIKVDRIQHYTSK